MTERACYHCRFSIGHPFGGLVCQLTEQMATEPCESWTREPGSDDDLCTQTNPPMNGNVSATDARSAT